MALTRRQTEDPRVLRENVLDPLIAQVGALDGNDLAACAAIDSDITTVAGIKTDVTAVAAVATSVTLIAGSAGTPSVTGGSETTGTIPVTIQCKTLAGGNLAASRLIRVWGNTSDLGAPSDTGFTFAATTGSIVSDDDGLNMVQTDATGKAVVAVTKAANGDLYIMASDNGGTKSVKLTFAAVE